MFTRQITLAALVLLMVGTAGAAINPIGEFTGDMVEGFEGIYSPGAYPGPIPLFDGFATMDDTLAHTCVIAYVWSGGGGVLYPYNGNLFGGGVAGGEIIQFSSPVMQFGGFFGTVGPMAGGTVNFYDEAGGLIETVSMTCNPADWIWQGWSSDVPFKSVEIIGANVPGVSTQLDDLRFSYLPEPSMLVLLTVGAGLVLRRR